MVNVSSPVRNAAAFLARSAGRLPVVLASGLLAFAASTAAHADPMNLIQNGSFETTTATNTQGGVTVGTNVNNMNLPGWQINNCDGSSTTCGFQFIAQQNYATNGIWDTLDNHYSTFYAPPGASPDGGNAFASDASYQTQALYQTMNNLHVGDTYVVKFYQASMQQTGYATAFTGNWAVGLTNSPSVSSYQFSANMNNPSQGSTGWVQQTMSFVANATSEALFFFATTSSGSNPPFLLLDGVSMADSTAVPEPATLSLAAVGFAGLLFARRRRNAQAA